MRLMRPEYCFDFFSPALTRIVTDAEGIELRQVDSKLIIPMSDQLLIRNQFPIRVIHRPDMILYDGSNNCRFSFPNISPRLRICTQTNYDESVARFMCFIYVSIDCCWTGL